MGMTVLIQTEKENNTKENKINIQHLQNEFDNQLKEYKEMLNTLSLEMKEKEEQRVQEHRTATTLTSELAAMKATKDLHDEKEQERIVEVQTDDVKRTEK